MNFDHQTFIFNFLKCHPIRQAGTYKNKLVCPQADATGVTGIPVFTDRLCNNVEDCPGGTDEDGSMATCVQSDPTPKNGCCKEQS